MTDPIHRQVATPAPTWSPGGEEQTIDELLAEVQKLRRELDHMGGAYAALEAERDRLADHAEHGATQLADLHYRLLAEQRAGATARAALVEFAGAVRWLASPSQSTGPLEGGRLHKVSGPAFRALVELLALLEGDR